MVVHNRISSCPGKIVQISPYNNTTVMNGDTFQIISLKLPPIMSVAEVADVVEVHTIAEDLDLECYRSTLVFSEH